MYCEYNIRKERDIQNHIMRYLTKYTKYILQFIFDNKLLLLN